MSLGGEVANLLLQLNAEKREYDSKQESIAMVRREIADLNNNIAALRTRRPFFAQSSEAEADLKKYVLQVDGVGLNQPEGLR